MNTRTIGFSFALSLAFAGTVFALEACSSSDSTTTTTDEDSGTHDSGASTSRPDTSTGSDTGTTTGDTGTGTGNDSSTPGDDSSTPGNDASDLADGGIPVTPGKVICGGATCDLSANACCALPDGGGTCSASACPSGTATIKCAEKADCTGTDVCCGTLNIAAGAADTKCGQGPCGTVQFCRTNSECTGGKDCVVQVCQGVTLELCGVFVGCTAK